MAEVRLGPVELLDKASWGRVHWKLFALVSMNFLLDGILFSIVPLTLFLVLPDQAITILLVNSIVFLAGAQVLGRLADTLGRRAMFLYSQFFDLVGAVLLIPFHTGFLEVAVLTSVINFGVGGDVGSCYAAMSELTPARHRGKALMLSINFWNVGASLIAGIALVLYNLYADITTQIVGLLLSVVGLAIFIRMVRVYLPESPRWLLTRGRLEEALAVTERVAGTRPSPPESSVVVVKESTVGVRHAIRKYRFRLIMLITITATQLLTYNMVAYYAPYAPGFAYGASSAPSVILVSNLGATVGALFLLPLIDRTRKASATLAFAGGLATGLSLIILHGSSFPIYLAMLLVNLIFSEFAWAVLSVLESELFPTGVRASLIGFITAIAWLSNAVVVYLEAYVNATAFLAASSALWLIGLLAALAWQLRGIESARKTLEALV